MGKSKAHGENKSGLTRRQWVKRLAGTAGAGLVLPSLASGEIAHKHTAEGTGAATAAAETTASTPTFFDAHQSETVAALAERILPGASRAQVAPFLDLALAADSAENQGKFLGALAALEAEAIQRFGHPFPALSEAQQNEILTAACNAGQPTGHKPGVRGEDWIASAAKAAEKPRDTLRDHFNFLKRRVGEAYYSSEIGMKELGWTGEMYYESFPDCRRSVFK